jgi:hypothetical protein
MKAWCRHHLRLMVWSFNALRILLLPWRVPFGFPSPSLALPVSFFHMLLLEPPIPLVLCAPALEDIISCGGVSGPNGFELDEEDEAGVTMASSDCFSEDAEDTGIGLVDPCLSIVVVDLSIFTLVLDPAAEASGPVSGAGSSSSPSISNTFIGGNDACRACARVGERECTDWVGDTEGGR